MTPARVVRGRSINTVMDGKQLFGLRVTDDP